MRTAMMETQLMERGVTQHAQVKSQDTTVDR